MTNELRSAFAYRLLGNPEVTYPWQQFDPRDDSGLVLDLDNRWNWQKDRSRKRWLITYENLPTEYESGDIADQKTVDRIDAWLVKQARMLDSSLYSLFKQLASER